MRHKDLASTIAVHSCHTKMTSEDSIGISSDGNVIALSDGCSTAIDSHISSLLTVQSFLDKPDFGVAVSSAHLLHEMMHVDQAASIIRVTKLENSKYNLNFAGDGFWGFSVSPTFFVLCKQSFIGAELPFYPHYWMSANEFYSKLTGVFPEPKVGFTEYCFQKQANGYYEKKSEVTIEIDVDIDYIHSLNNYVGLDHPMVFIASDGLDKIQNYLTGEMVSLEQALTFIDPLSYKYGDYAFAERRMKVILRNNNKLLDDLSFGMMIDTPSNVHTES